MPAIDLAAADHNGSAGTVSLSSAIQASSVAVAVEPATRGTAETAAAAGVLRSAGWHVTSIDASTPLAVAWQRLPRAAEMLIPTGSGHVRHASWGDHTAGGAGMNPRLAVTAGGAPSYWRRCR